MLSLNNSWNPWLILDEIPGSKSFSKFDLAQKFHQVSIREGDCWKTNFRSRLGQFSSGGDAFWHQRASAVLMRMMNAAIRRGLRQGSEHHFEHQAAARGLIGAPGPLSRCVVVYMDDLLCMQPVAEAATQRRHRILIYSTPGKALRQSLKVQILP